MKVQLFYESMKTKKKNALLTNFEIFNQFLLIALYSVEFFRI